MNASRSLQEAVCRLNKFNVDHLWKVCGCLSYWDDLERFDGEPCGFGFPILNFQKNALFSRAIIESRSASYKERRLSYEDMIFVLNSMTETDSHCEIDDTSLSNRQRILSYFSKKVNFQLPLQKGLSAKEFGRAYALFSEIPRKYASDLKSKFKSGYIDIPAEFHKVTGLSPHAFLAYGIAVLSLIFERYKRYLRPPAEVRESILHLRNAEKARVVLDCWNVVKERLDTCSFVAQNLTLSESTVFCESNARRFLEVTARSTNELRQFVEKISPEGFPAPPEHVSPFERYPIVELFSGSYVVPIPSYLARAIPACPHWILREVFEKPNNDYDRVAGMVLEKYVCDVFCESLTHACVIPEREYHHNSERKDGPDLIIVDESAGSLVAIEVKGSATAAKTRNVPFTKDFTRGIEGAIKALKRLPEKTAECLQNNRAYPELTEIMMCRDFRFFYLVIIRDGIKLLPEILHEYRKSGEISDLEGICDSMSIMTLETCENALAIARKYNVPFSKLLEDYEACAKQEGFRNSMAEDFGGRGVQQVDSVPYAFFERFSSDVGLHW